MTYFRDEVIDLLSDNAQWINIFSGYANALIGNAGTYNVGNTPKPDEVIETYVKNLADHINIHSLISLVKLSSTIGYALYGLRFRGRHICTLSLPNKGTPSLHFTDEDRTKIRDSFGFSTNKTDFDINSQDAQNLFRQLAGANPATLHNPKRQLEAIVLKELSKEDGDNKIEEFHYVQPVKYGGGILQMPTPLETSGVQPHISVNNEEATGADIDILARMSTPMYPRNWSLAIFETVSENTNQRDVMNKALAYGTFVGQLLLNDTNDRWWNIFRDQGDGIALLDGFKILVITLEERPNPGGAYTPNPIALHSANGKRSIELIPCTCYVTIDRNTGTVLSVDGSFLQYKRQ